MENTFLSECLVMVKTAIFGHAKACLTMSSPLTAICWRQARRWRHIKAFNIVCRTSCLVTMKANAVVSQWATPTHSGTMNTTNTNVLFIVTEFSTPTALCGQTTPLEVIIQMVSSEGKVLRQFTVNRTSAHQSCLVISPKSKNKKANTNDNKRQRTIGSRRGCLIVWKERRTIKGNSKLNRKKYQKYKANHYTMSTWTCYVVNINKRHMRYFLTVHLNALWTWLCSNSADEYATAWLNILKQCFMHTFQNFKGTYNKRLATDTCTSNNYYRKKNIFLVTLYP